MSTTKHAPDLRRQAARSLDPWDATKAGLERELNASVRRGGWEALREGSSAVGRFDHPGDLIAFIQDRARSRDAVNELLLELVRAAQRKVGVAHTVLCVALWPGLSAIRARWLRSSRGRDAELAADIGSLFVLCVGKLDLTRRCRVAATLCRNTARDLARDRRRARASPNDGGCWGRRRPREEEEDFETRECLERECGRDAELMMRVVVDGERTVDAARAMGIPSATARQRIRRMRGKLERALAA